MNVKKFVICMFGLKKSFMSVEWETMSDLKKQCNGLQITLYVIILEDYCEL